jgi:hypothetical protein
METNVSEKQEHARRRLQGALNGALYGLFMGTAFVVVMILINRWLYPEIPFGIDRSKVIVFWLLIGVGTALVGAVTCMIEESLIGLLVGAAAGGFLALGGTLLFSEAPTGMKWIVLIFTLAPMAVFALPIVWILRRMTREHIRALASKWKYAIISLLLLISVVLGGGAGYFTKIDERTLHAVQLVNDGLRAGGDHKGVDVGQLAGWQEHGNMLYKLFWQKSESTTEGLDVRAVYDDGYIVLCVVNAYPGYDPFIQECRVDSKAK